MKKHSFRNKPAFLLYLVLICLFVGCGSNDNRIVATYDGGFITFKDMKVEIDGYTNKEKSELSSNNDFVKVARKLALENILLEEAINSGISQESEFKEKLQDSRNNIGFEILKKKNVLDKIFIVEADYHRYKKIYSLYQIVKRTDIPDESKIASSKNLLNSLSKSIKTLDQFKNAAAKYSDDVTSVKGGFVGEIKLGVMEEEIDRALEKITVGKVSGIVETSAGLHLLYVDNIREVELGELLSDKRIGDDIYKAKEEYYENEWYEKLLSDSKYKLNIETLKKKVYDDEIVAQYEDKIITRKNAFESVDKLRQNGAFPEPTFEELIRLVKNLSLGIIIKKKLNSDSLLNSAEYKDRIKKEEEFLLRNEYIARNVKNRSITDLEIVSFYNNNKKTLFTFTLDNGKEYVQPINEVKEFIVQKISDSYSAESKYDFYRDVIEKNNFKVDEKKIDLFIASLKKK
ncbi:MAG TPA: peptidylprolyl isomerase [Spirochaetota bacterium]|nr:MAG: Foldase protein PrsA precursor [Spirochaetes bacterium ADurb.Bin133]HPY88542.1 peptidylprolyl isomerase [Spirochaetota bacterium]HQB60899.1 peptidylprolyl isomerase [Spirochaetota bacterium]